MVRILLLLIMTLYLNASECTHCEQKFKDAFFYHQGVKALYLGENTAISIKKPKSNYIYNPFLNLYLIKDVKHSQSVDLKFPFAEEKVGLFDFVTPPKDVKLTKQCGIRSFAKSSTKPGEFSIFSGLCCHVLALSNRYKAVIDSKYLKDFVQRKSAIYGDIGVRFSDKGHVAYVNPYLQISLQKDDKVLNYSLCDLEEKILFAKPGSTIGLKVQRGGKTLNLEVKVYKKVSGGYISDTFLEHLGIQFNSNLEVVYIQKNSTAYTKGVKVGDKFLRINNTPLQSQSDIKKILTKKSEEGFNFLLERDEFQFFMQF